MIHADPYPSETLGADLRALRKARGLKLQDMASALSRSVGWVSQVERDLSEPTISDLRRMANVLDISVTTLFRHGETTGREDGYIVRRDARRPIGSRAPGLVEELLSPDLTDDFEMVHSTFEPHSHIATPVTRPTQEVGYMVSGQLDLVISDTRFSVGPGDSFRIRGEPFCWSNPHDAPAVAIWVIAPPVY